MGRDERDPTWARRLGGRALPPLAVLAVAIGAWEAGARLGDASPTVLPTPARVAQVAWDDRAQLAVDARTTLIETLAGLGLAIVMAVVIGLLVDAWRPARQGLLPLLVISQTLPIIALAPLIVVWFDLTILPKVLIVALYTFFPICLGLIAGLAATGSDAIGLLRTMGARPWQVLRYLRLPGAAPSTFTGLRLSVTYAVSAAVTAEWLGGISGLGIYMVRARNSFQTDLIFAAVLVTALLTLALYALVAIVERTVAGWVASARA